MPRLSTLLSGLGLTVLVLLSVPLALLAYAYLLGHLPPDVVAANPFWPHLLPAHASLGATALPLGFLQFIPRLRNGYPKVHRWIGRTYAVGCLLGGTAGLILALGASTGPVTTFGFGTLALLWIGTTATGWRLAWLGRTQDHRRWMVRSFAMTLAFVTFRLELLLGIHLLGLPFAVSYQGAAVLCWVTNLAAAELLLRRGSRRVRGRAVPA